MTQLRATAARMAASPVVKSPVSRAPAKRAPARPAAKSQGGGFAFDMGEGDERDADFTRVA